MTRRFAKFLTLISLVVTTGSAWSQDVTVSQFMANPLFTNAGFAGSSQGLRATIMYRTQWPSIHSSFESYTASYDQNLQLINSGFGVSYMTNKVGGDALITASMSAYYAYHFRPSDDLKINLGLRGTYFQKRLNYGIVKSSVEYDTIRTMIGIRGADDIDPRSSLKKADVSVGVVFSYKETFFGGISAEHLNTPNISFYEGDTLTNLGIKTSFFAGANIELLKSSYIPLILTPTAYYQGGTGFQQFSIGSFLSRGPFFTGGWYRLDFNNDAAIMAMFGAQYKELILGYSFDYSLSSDSTFNGGAHEITLSYQIKNDKQHKSKSMNQVPISTAWF